MPRRVYTHFHADYIAEAFENVAARRDSLKGFCIVEQPKRMRRVTAK